MYKKLKNFLICSFREVDEGKPAFSAPALFVENGILGAVKNDVFHFEEV